MEQIDLEKCTDYELLLNHIVCGEHELLMLDSLLCDTLKSFS